MKWLEIIRDLFKPVTDLIDSINAPKESKLKLEKHIADLKTEVTMKGLELEKEAMIIGGDVVKAETKGESKLQRNWRPLVMIWFAILIGLYWFEVTPASLSENVAIELLVIIKIALGGYVFGRSGEKMVKAYSNGKK